MSHRSIETELLWNLKRQRRAAEAVEPQVRHAKLRAALTASLVWAGGTAALLAAFAFLR